MDILSHDKIRFEKSESGALNITFEDERVIENVYCVPLFPFSDTDNFISVVRKKGREFEEIGIITHFKELSPLQRKLVRENIKFRYFIPEITDIKKIKARHRLWKFDVVTDRGEKIFYVRHTRENVTVKDDGRIIITDIEKCRYTIPRYKKLPGRARIELDRILL